MTMLFSFKKKADKQVEKVVEKTSKTVGKATKSVGKAANKVEKTVSKAMSSGFANGLVGSDVEAPEFDPLQLAAGRSAETLNWYRAAELKVMLQQLLSVSDATFSYMFSPYTSIVLIKFCFLVVACQNLHACRSRSVGAACLPSTRSSLR